MNAVRSLAVCFAAVCVTSAAGAQASRLNPAAVQLERQGRFAEAARVYAAHLGSEPAHVAALLGLERVLNRLGWLDSIVPYVARGVEAEPYNEPIRELEFRVATSVYEADTVVAVARRWIAAIPESATPYQYWAFWLVQRGDLQGARTVLEDGRSRLGVVSLVPYTAQFLITTGDWLAATREWRLALEEDETLIAAAASSLWHAPEYLHEQMLRALMGEHPDPVTRRLAADLLVRWDRPREAWTMLDRALPRERARAVELLEEFAERTRQVPTPAGARARGYALERVAELSTGSTAARARLDAARAFADAGELASAQRLLNRLPRRPSDTAAADAAAKATLIRVLADAGRLKEADARFREWESELSVGDVRIIRVRLAWAWVRSGELERAEGVLHGDSTVGAQAVLGWVALYRGHLDKARTRFRAAGPYAEAREEATRRSAMLVLLERVQAGALPPLGDALLRLARGDTARAVKGLESVARTLPKQGGRADLLVYAGELAIAIRDYDKGEPLLQLAIATDSTGPAAPTAHYALGAMYARLGRDADAVARLERLILGYPESALVPQARRLLDEVRGMIPNS